MSSFKLIKSLFIPLCLLSVVGCNKNNTANVNADNHFGDFSYKGIFLKEHADRAITLAEAKGLVYANSKPTALRGIKPMYRSNEDATNSFNDILNNYGILNVTVSYYVSDSEGKQTRKDMYQGTDLYNLLDTNFYEPFGQMCVKYIYVDDEILDEMELENQLFVEEYKNLKTPFNEPYTFHSNRDKTLIVQQHSFAELPASVDGGIGSTFRQDCELVFDKNGKISIWQSSLGLYTATPTGTVKQGYIFEAEFEWIEK